MSQILETDGGSGEESEIDVRRHIHETRAIERAIRERWPIPTEARERVAAEMARIVSAVVKGGKRPLYSTRERTAAARVLAMIDRINLENEKRDDPTPSPPVPQVSQTLNVQVNEHHHHDNPVTIDERAASLAALIADELTRREDGAAGGIDPAASLAEKSRPHTNGKATRIPEPDK